MLSFKVTTVGSSEGLILNKEAKRILNVQKGDTLYLTEAPDGAMRISGAFLLVFWIWHVDIPLTSMEPIQLGLQLAT